MNKKTSSLLKVSTDAPRTCAPKELLYLPYDVLQVFLSFLSQPELCHTWAFVSHCCYETSCQPCFWTTLTLCPQRQAAPPSLDHLPLRCSELSTLNCSRFRTLEDELVVKFAQQCTKLCRVNLAFCVLLTDAAVVALARHCPHLTVLSCEGCPLLTEGSLAAVENLRNLTYLNLSFCPRLCSEALGSIAALSRPLVDLNLDGCPHLRDPSLMQIAVTCKSLTSLQLDGEELSDLSIIAISESLPHVQLLHLSFCNGLTDESLFALQSCADLVSLRLKKGLGFSAAGMQSFFGAHPWESMCALDMTDCQKMDDEVCHLIAKHCPNLMRLNISWCWHVSDQGLEPLILSLSLLTQLDLCGLKKLSDASVCIVPRLRHLKFLCLTQCNGISDDLIAYMVQAVPGITVLDYYDTPHGNTSGKFRM